MSLVTRLSGAILAESNGEYFLIGNTKSPCDWAAAGFEPPGELGLRRAERVRDLLVAAGIDRACIEVSSRGENDPAVRPGDQIFERRNRRVDITVR